MRTYRWPLPVDRWAEQVNHWLTVLFPPDAPATRIWDTSRVWGWMMGLIWHESRGNPDAVNRRVYDDPYRQAAGLFQHMPVYWSGRVPGRDAGRLEFTIDALNRLGVEPQPWYGEDDPLPTESGRGILHPTANIAVAVWLFRHAGPGAWAPHHKQWSFDHYEHDTAWAQHEGDWVRVRVTGSGVAL